MMPNTVSTLDPGHDVSWLARFWLASALTLAAVATLALFLGLLTHMEAFVAGAILLAGYGVILMYLRSHVSRGQEKWYLALGSIGHFGLMVLLLPLVPWLAAAIVPAALIPVFVATPHLRRSELTRYSIGVLLFSLVYATIAVLMVAGRGATAGQLATLTVQVIAAVTVIGFMLVLLRRYFEAHGDAQYLALHDSLTGLANRTLFMDRLAHALERGKRNGAMTSILFMDLDAFKAVNDTNGHGFGDAVLRGVAARISESTRSSETTARVGGDEFAVLLEDLEEPAQAVAIAERLRRALAQPIETPGGRVPVQVSMGIAVNTDGSQSPEDLLRNADGAMYESKRDGRAEPIVYQSAMRSASDERTAIKAGFHGVLERGELRLEYQPLVRLHAGHDSRPGRSRSAGAIEAFEALLRWDDPERGLLAPGQFVKLAEETGDIVMIGRWVLEQTLKQVAEWRRSSGMPWLRASVNISQRQLQETDFEDVVTNALAGAGLKPDALVIEVTEKALLGHTHEPRDVLQRLRGQGVQLAIDDLGTGYASLGWLKTFPVDAIKLDGSMVTDAIGNTRDAALLKNAIELGRALDAEVVAEGVETTEQLRLLRSLRCDVAQGFLFSRPLAPSTAVQLLRAETKPWASLLANPNERDAKQPLGSRVSGARRAGIGISTC